MSCKDQHTSKEACLQSLVTLSSDMEEHTPMTTSAVNDQVGRIEVVKGCNVHAVRTPDTFGSIIDSTSNSLRNCRRWTRRRLIDVLYILCTIGYLVYIVYAIQYDPSSAFWGVVDATLLLLYVLHRFIKLQRIADVITKPIRTRIKERRYCRVKPKMRRLFRRCLTIVIFISYSIFIAFDAYSDFQRFIPLGGLCLLVFTVFVTSKAPFKVNWIPVLWGLIVQFLFGIIILRWRTGYEVCKFIGDAVAGFLRFTDEGSKFVFGEENYTMHIVAFKILPVVVYFSAVVSILYYLGVMQAVVKGLARLFQFAMNTTAIESFATAVHIFIGQVESSVTLKPYLRDLTLSELNAVMTSGFATVAGSVIAAYIEFGVPPEHVISASFMSAPAALAVAKLSWPETTKIREKDRDIYRNETGKELNIMEAASVGAIAAVKLVAYVVVNLIAFVGLLAFVDYCLSFMGARVGHPEFTFEFVCSYLFMPVAIVIGVPWNDCGKVSQLIGKKIFINEFLAFADLGEMIKNSELEDRSIVIATYILCGFGSVAAMGINLGALTAAEPSRRQDYANSIFRAMIGGNIACFMTACVAGILYQDSIFLAGINTTDITLNLTLLNSSFMTSNTFVPT